MIPEINLPQAHVTGYDKALSVMLYQYLRTMRQAINALLGATGVEFPLGSDTLSEDAVAVTEAVDQPMTLRDKMKDDTNRQILIELRIMNIQFAHAFGIQDNIEAMRHDPSILN